MHIRFSIKACSAAGALAASMAFGSAAYAQEGELPGASYTTPAVLAQAAPHLPPASAGLPDPRPEWPGGASASPAPMNAAAAPQLDPQARNAWLRECRRRTDLYYDNGESRGGSGGLFGALLGGVAGGLIGNRIDDGPDRAVGSVVGAAAGAVIGAVAGSAIDKASSRKRVRDYGYDYCEAYLDDYYRYYAQAGYSGYAHPGYGHMMMMAPRMTMVPTRVASPAAQQPCEEVVTEEWVPERTRAIPRRPARAPVRRRVPDKRIRVY